MPRHVGSLLVAFSSLFFIARKRPAALLMDLVKVFVYMQAASPFMGPSF